MIEVEVKARVTDPDQLKERLRELGCDLHDVVEQRDHIFMSPYEGGDTGRTRNVLRLREQGDKVLLTLKQDRTGELDCLEEETTVGDRERAEAILKLLGFELWTKVTKRRQQGRWGDRTVCVDEVEDLGWFFEVEVMAATDDTVRLQDDLWQELKQAGLPLGDRVTKGYDTLINELKGPASV